MLIGYARVSINGESIDRQRDALLAAGCEVVYSDVASGAASELTALSELLSIIRPRDTLVVCKLDRLGLTLPLLVETVAGLGACGVGFRSLQDSIDTTLPNGNLIIHVFETIAQFQRDIIRERTSAGLRSARARGHKGGRPRLLTTDQLASLQAMFSDPTVPVNRICATFQVSRTTLYRYLAVAARASSNSDSPPEISRGD